MQPCSTFKVVIDHLILQSDTPGPTIARSSACSGQSGAVLYAVPTPDQLEQAVCTAHIPDQLKQMPHAVQSWTSRNSCHGLDLTCQERAHEWP